MRIQQDESTPSTHPTVVRFHLTVSRHADGGEALRDVAGGTSYRAASDRVAGDESRWPTPVIKVGRSVRIPTTALLAALGIDPEEVELAIRDTAWDHITGEASAA